MLEYFKHASVQQRGKELLANEGGEPNADKGGGGGYWNADKGGVGIIEILKLDDRG